MVIISAGCNERGHLNLVIFTEKKQLKSEKAKFFIGVKAFFKTEMKISTFQDAGHNLNGVPTLIMNCDELNRLTGRTYSIRRFIFYAMARGGHNVPPPLNTLVRTIVE